MKKIKLNSKELVDTRKKLTKEMELFGEQQEGLIKLNQKHEKQKYKIDRIKKKGSKILHKVLLAQYKMEEFDIASTYEIIDKDNIEIEIANQWDDNFSDLEGLKNKLREDKKNKVGLWKDEMTFTGHKE